MHRLVCCLPRPSPRMPPHPSTKPRSTSRTRAGLPSAGPPRRMRPSRTTIISRCAWSREDRAGRLRAFRAGFPDHRQALRAERLGAYRRPDGARSGSLAHRHRRGAHHGVHALRRPFGGAGRHPAVDAALAEIRGQPRAGPGPLHRGRGRRLSRQGMVRGRQPGRSFPQGDWPAREAVQTFGPAYRYPSAGWIYLHIEGKPYERGYQHGHLMAREIPEYLERCAADLGGKPTSWS